MHFATILVRPSVHISSSTQHLAKEDRYQDSDPQPFQKSLARLADRPRLHRIQPIRPKRPINFDLYRLHASYIL